MSLACLAAACGSSREPAGGVDAGGVDAGTEDAGATCGPLAETADVDLCRAEHSGSLDALLAAIDEARAATTCE